MSCTDFPDGNCPFYAPPLQELVWRIQENSSFFRAETLPLCEQAKLVAEL